MAAGRIAPEEYAVGVQPVRGGVVPDPADRGPDVLQRRREARLTAEPVVDRRHGEALRGQGVVETRSQHGQRLAARAAPPPAAVHVYDDGRRSVGLGQVQIELEWPVAEDLAVHQVRYPPDGSAHSADSCPDSL